MSEEKRVNDKDRKTGIKDNIRALVQEVIKSPDLVRNIIAVAILLAAGATSFAVDVPEGADSTPFKIAMLVIIAFRILQDVIRGTVEAITFILPLAAAASALVATALLGVPFVESLEKPEMGPFVTAIISSGSLVIFYMLLNGLFGPKSDEDRWVSSSETVHAKRREDESFSHLDGETPGWPPEFDHAPHRYWVSYTFRYGWGSGNGSCALARTAPITCGYDVLSIAEFLRLDIEKTDTSLGPVRVAITSWVRFEAPEKPPGSTEDLPVESRPANVIAFSRSRAA